MTTGEIGEAVEVLLIEDNPGDARLIQEMLSEASQDRYQLECADRLSKGLERLGNGGIDIVLLDLGLPDSQGIDAFEQVQAQAPVLPIIVLTGFDDEVLAIEAIRHGAQDYLVKGDVDSTVLYRAVRHAVERKHLEGKLRVNEANFGDVMIQSADGIVLVDKDGIVLFVNPAAESLFGRKADELVNKPFSFPIEAGKTTELNTIGGDGKAALAEMQVVEVEWQGEKAYLASLRDITKRQQLLAELVQTRQQQLELKSQFLSHASHELLSPLTPIYEIVTALLDGSSGNLTPEQRENLEIVLRNTNQLQTMVNDLLEVTGAKMDDDTLSAAIQKALGYEATPH